MSVAEETICAQATANGRGGVGILRLSGEQTRSIAEQILGKLPTPRVAELLDFNDEQGQPIDQGLAIFFPDPNSFTGEDVLELQGHGGPVVMDQLMRRVLRLGARAARPGEFSERAFLNGKMDLVQAEAIADLIDSASEQAARSAVRSLQGAFSVEVHQLVEWVTELRIYVESSMDFPEEEIDFLAEGDVSSRLENIIQQLERVLESAKEGVLLQEGMTLVIAGRPNAGKSSLLNALSGKESAIVTEIPGTTRDLLKEQVEIDGLPIHIIDTAGLRESEDRVEQEGIRRAWLEIEKADRVLLLVDDQQGIMAEDQQTLQQIQQGGEVPVTIVRTKVDLSGGKAGLHNGEIALSSKAGLGMDALRDFLKQAAGYQASGEGTFLARRRHLEALQQARCSLQQGREQLNDFHAGELLAEELRMAQEALSEITGEFSSDDLLGKIFSSFCIGK
ncbi:MAG: tRNA uridine-5-carboxymethylaminomethyl(34) synthesis GTPase MnmE [Gammaproteobacteria bacterium]|nr:tRNA uridine-5-carboxymethylaminomethyl(34) synthesis GTPase MnmE [Gammaproteobacteria bacterium]MBT4331196.1 tRNA uridine-5-carboxymethylaminomethyl(34) synthesis GTPase MnmE [Gammaproteobacteria bacterium]MBT5635299.1 tRNA uridine-5-carboxymethylaminomethyl(34) synthesis GTPase MnmE [Gammaproteobacteria bacterium]MBT6669577.1 tRNA uridine-5-carboxymethylaminomethyl(34) synthesis GTPase MnmE [Gammaproteobacteria bacterium]MBT7231302.1 tRNA uridine-5-carboxymethylaminomethyl(34) synthesis GT